MFYYLVLNCSEVSTLLCCPELSEHRNALDIDYNLLFCETLLLKGSFEAFNQLTQRTECIMMNHLNTIQFQPYPQRSRLYQQISRMKNIKLLLPFVDVEKYQKNDRLLSIRSLRMITPSSFESVEYWEQIFHFRQAVYSKYDVRSSPADIRSDFEHTSLQLFQVYYDKALYLPIIESAIAMRDRGLLSTSMIVNTRDYVLKITSKYGIGESCRNSILYTNPQLMEKGSLSVLYRDLFEVMKPTHAKDSKVMNDLSNAITTSLFYNVRDAESWDALASLCDKKKDKDQFVLSLLASIELSSSVNIRSFAQFFMAVHTINNTSILQNATRIAPRLWLPFSPLLFVFNNNKYQRLTPIIRILIQHCPQEAYQYLSYQLSVVKQDVNVNLLFPDNDLLEV